MSILEKHFQKTIFDIEMSTKKKAKPMKTINSMFMELPLLARSRSVRHGSSEVQPDNRYETKDRLPLMFQAELPLSRRAETNPDSCKQCTRTTKEC